MTLLLNKQTLYIIFYLLTFYSTFKISASNIHLSPKSMISYAKENQFIKELTIYPKLLAIIKNNPHVFNALISDPTLRPVFLIKLSKDKDEVGNIENIAPNLLNLIGGEKLIDKYTGFYVGHFDKANKYLEKGYKLIVGITDRYFEIKNNPIDKNITFQGVSSARTAYFPLIDGTWLSVKGSGFFKHNIGENELSYFIGDTENLGLLNKYELSGIKVEREKLNDSFLTKALAVREIYKLPNDENSLKFISIINEEQHTNISAFLLFKRVATPHRLVKIYQLNDNNIEIIRNNISKSLISLRRLHIPFENNYEWFQFIIKCWAKNEAYKFNELIISSSFHAQDMQLGGEDEDSTELFDFHTAINNVALNIFYPEVFSLIEEEFNIMINKLYLNIENLRIKEHILLLAGIYSKLQPIIIILSNNEKPSPLPDSIEEKFSYFEIFFKNFFKSIKSNYVLEKWLFTQYDIQDQYGVYINPLQAILCNKEYSFSVFHKDYDKNAPAYINSEQKIKREHDLLQYIYEWLKDEYIARNTTYKFKDKEKLNTLVETSS